MVVWRVSLNLLVFEYFQEPDDFSVGGANEGCARTSRVIGCGSERTLEVLEIIWQILLLDLSSALNDSGVLTNDNDDGDDPQQIKEEGKAADEARCSCGPGGHWWHSRGKLENRELAAILHKRSAKLNEYALI